MKSTDKTRENGYNFKKKKKKRQSSYSTPIDL